MAQMAQMAQMANMAIWELPGAHMAQRGSQGPFKPLYIGAPRASLAIYAHMSIYEHLSLNIAIWELRSPYGPYGHSGLLKGPRGGDIGPPRSPSGHMGSQELPDGHIGQYGHLGHMGSQGPGGAHILLLNPYIQGPGSPYGLPGAPKWPYWPF